MWCVENFQFNNIFDNSLAKRDLGFRYAIPYREGVRRCIEHLRQHGGIEDAGNYPFYDEIITRWQDCTG